MSLRLKYAFYASALILAAFTVFAVVNYRFQARSLRTELMRRTEMSGEYIKSSLYAHMLAGRSGNFQSFLESQVKQDLEEVRVFDPEDGTILASSIPKEVGKSIYPTDFEAYNRNTKPRVFEHEKDGRVFFSKVEPLYNETVCHSCHAPEKKVIGVLDIELSPEETLRHSLSDLRYLSLAFLAGTLLLAAGTLYIVTGRLVTVPLHAVMNIMQRTGRGDFSGRFHTPRIDEIGHLARSLNALLETVETRRKESSLECESQIRNLERLASVGSMTAAIAHDIKNPLAGISSAVQVIAEDLPEEDARREIIDEIQQRIIRLDQTIRDVRNYARPASPQFIPVQLNTVIESIVRLINRDVSAASAEIDLQLASNLPEVQMDPDMIQDAIRTVSLFCLHNMKNGGRLILSSLKKDETRLQIRIEGVDGNVWPNLSDALFHPLDRGEKGGMNLALAVAKRIIDEHHGIISVSPASEGGARFVIVIPLSQKLTHA